MPATAWLGLSDNPGDIPGIGPTDADTCRDLAGTLAANPAIRWCITLTDPHGRAVAHGCARAGPGPPGPGRRSWLATVTITPITASTCDHRHQSAGYQPSPRLRHLVKTRSPRCGYPGCRGPPSDATTTIRSRTTRADGRASAICTRCAATTIRSSRHPAGTSPSPNPGC